MCKEQVNKKYKDRLFRQVFGTKEIHKAEVKNVILEEYNQEEHMKSEREEWREIGREEGKAAGKAEYILELLCELGDVPAKLRQKIMAQQDLSVLKKWFRLAVKAQTIEEFEKQM